MKIFSGGSGWSEKVNFADKNNVFVGYDMGQSCCENADWFISSKEENEDKNSNGITENLEEYVFDTNYFEVVEFDGKYGEMIRFKLIADNKPDLYLHIYNSHNGYYGHGFEAKIGDTSWQQGTL